MFEELSALFGTAIKAGSIRFSPETPLDEIVTQLLDQKVPHLTSHKVIEKVSEKVKCTEEEKEAAHKRICDHYADTKDSELSSESQIFDFFQSLSEAVSQREEIEEEPDHYKYSLANFNSECEVLMRNFLRYIPRKHFNDYSLVNEKRIVKLMALYLKNRNSERLGPTMLINEAHDIEVRLKSTMKQISA